MQMASGIANTRIGTCPHGLPVGACPICNGMGGGGGKKADFSAKPGEMSWSECAAIGAFLKAQQEARTQRQQDFVPTIPFQARIEGAAQKIANFIQVISNNFPPVIAKPVIFVLRMVNTTINVMKNIAQKFADISDKLAAMIGEFKAAAKEKASKFFENFRKKAKGLFLIFVPFAEQEDLKDERKSV